MSLLDLFGKKQYVRIRHNGYLFELFASPGKWMEREQLEELQGRMITIAVARLGVKPSFSFFVDIDTLKNKLVTICSNDGGDCAFNALTYIGEYQGRNVIHLGATYSIVKDKGLMQLTYFWMCMFIMVRNAFRTVYITSLTHAPRIFGAIAESFSNVFPKAVSGEYPLPFHLDIKELLLDTYLKEWDLPTVPLVSDSFSIKGFRAQKDGTILYPDTAETVPRHRLARYNKYCVDNITYEDGDEILQIGTLKASDFFKNVKLFRKGN